MNKMVIDCSEVDYAIDEGEGSYYLEYANGDIKITYPDGSTKDHYVQFEMQYDSDEHLGDIINNIIEILSLDPEEYDTILDKIQTAIYCKTKVELG